MSDAKNKLLDKIKKYKHKIADFELTDEDINNYLIDINRIIKIIELCETSPNVCGADGYHFKLTKDKDNKIIIENFICEKNKNNFAYIIKNNYWYTSNDIVNQQQRLKKNFINTENEYKIRGSLINTLLKIKRHQINLNGIYLKGNFGSGKSYILTAFCNEMALSNKSIIYFTMTSFCLDIMKSIQDQSSFKNDIVEQMIACDILVIEDLGSDIFRDIIHTQILFPVLNYRMNSDKLTIFSSRFNLLELKKIYNSSSNKKLVEQFIDKITRISRNNIFDISIKNKN